jgi:drug/metabolite transporter (DMT)-like permease
VAETPAAAGRSARAPLGGWIAAALGGAFFGTLGTFSKLFYNTGGSPFQLIFFRVVGSLLILGVAVIARRRLRLGRAPLLFALALGLPQLGQNYSLLEGFSRAPAGLVILMFYVYPLVVFIGEWLLFREKIDATRAAVLAIGTLGIALTVGKPSSAPIVGVLLGLAAGLCTGTYILGSRWFFTRHHTEPIEMIALMHVVPSVALVGIASARGLGTPSAKGWMWAVIIVAVSSVLAMLCFYTGIQRAGALSASLLATLEPFVAVTLAFFVLHESLSLVQLLGGALILGAVITLTTLRAQPSSEGREPLNEDGQSSDLHLSQ